MESTILPEIHDGLEITGVKNMSDPGEPTYFVVNNDDPELYSVFAHCTEGGVEWLEDFFDLGDAQACAKDLAEKFNLPVRDFTS